jgi:hypothetical protein
LFGIRQLSCLSSLHEFISTKKSLHTEPVCINVYGAKESIPLAYVAWRASTSNRVVVLARQAGNRFLGLLKVLQIRAQDPVVCFEIFSVFWQLVLSR